MIGPAYERFRLLGMAEDDSLHYCANCKNCDISCPQGVPVSSLNMLARAEQCERLGHSLRDWVLAHGEVLASWLRPIPAGLKNFGMRNPATRQALHMLGIHKNAPLPAFAPHSFRQALRHITQPGHSRHVLLFPGCYIDVYDPQTGLDMVWALNRAGYDVIVPDELACCGLPLVANGFWRHARANAERNLRALAPWRDANVPLITACPSCALLFNADLPEYFPDLAKKYGISQLYDAQEFLLDALDDLLTQSATASSTPTWHLAYHAPCHLRAQGNGLPGLELLRRLPGIRVDNADAGCCGMAGSYGFKKEKYAIAQTVGSRLFAAVRESKAEAVVSECGTCRVQLKHGTGLHALHPVNILRKQLHLPL
ncbi:MAG: anaerobic glycerol-3-phosphate dehydrogenase subunit C, partial [Desulfovibrio sp.]|nr:anaerobic glycerol-3-phosphate dehydrogenase subunit C [Desulfovibrio sp.]